MPDVAVGQKISTAADARFSFARRAAIDRDEFAKCIFVADFEISRFAFVLQILRLLTNRAVRVEFIARARAHRSAKRDVMLQPAIFAEHNLGADYAIRTDDRSRANFGF